MDLAAAARDGVNFFTHKSTEATWTKHRNYGEAMRRARDAGIPVLGAYHVVRSPANAAAEVDYCLSYVDQQTPWWRDWPYWFWQVDLEKWPYDAVPASEGEHFADLIEARTGRKAVIYASRGQYGDQLTGTSHDLWNANYGANITDHYRDVYAARGGDSGSGWIAYSGRMPVFWQFGSRCTIGSQTICDGNAFRGTLDQLRALIAPATGAATKGTDMLLIKTADDPTVYISDGHEYRPLGPDEPAGSAEAAYNAATKAGHKPVEVANMAQLEAIAGRPATEAEPVPITLSEADRQDIAARVAALMPTAQQIAAATGALEADADRARADVLDGPAGS